jgi:hypothetical protein
MDTLHAYVIIIGFACRRTKDAGLDYSLCQFCGQGLSDFGDDEKMRYFLPTLRSGGGRYSKAPEKRINFHVT